MPKTGRNDPCPCGSGQKYKRCCMAKDQAAEYAPLPKLETQQAEAAAIRAQQRAEFEQMRAVADEADELDRASNGVVDLIHAGRLDEAEHAARDLLVRYPEVPDGHDRLGMVYEARGQNRQAADCYRQVVEFMRARPADFGPESEANFLKLIAKLDPPNAAG
jgi:hypothetical protein